MESGQIYFILLFYINFSDSRNVLIAFVYFSKLTGYENSKRICLIFYLFISNDLLLRTVKLQYLANNIDLKY